MLLPLKLKEQIRLRSTIIKREFYLTFHHLTLYFKLDIKQSTSINIFDPIIESLFAQDFWDRHRANIATR